MSNTKSFSAAALVCLGVSFGAEGQAVAQSILAQGADQYVAASEQTRAPLRHSAATEVPRIAYADTAFGVSKATLGAAGFGEARNGVNSEAHARVGGGLRIWGAPIERLLLVLDAQRSDENERFVPAVTAQFRVFGGEREGWALGVLARYKTEGFAELGGEVEGGLLGSLSNAGLHLDANVVAGADFDGGVSDGECLARGGYDVLSFLRLGAEGRVRYRLTGKTQLPGNRAWDGFGGAQVLAFADHYFGAVTGGPSTVGISDRIGWSVIASAGGVMF
jgi:hypothetical protein